MPNWCQNQLWIFAPADVLAEIAETGLSLEKIRPHPEDASDWIQENWGTRDFGPLNAPETSVSSGMEVYEDSIWALFDSAWSPPIPIVKFLGEKYQDRDIKVSLEYFEEGARFIGMAEWENGKMTEDHCDYNDADGLADWLHSREHFIDDYKVDEIREEDEMMGRIKEGK